MLKEETSIILFVVLIIFCDHTQPVPDGYCLPPLNQSDCGHPPTAVFSYYKPGTRCEIRMWRGCPTNNMFQNELICSHYCIGRLSFLRGEAFKKEFNKTIKDLDIDELVKIRNVVKKAMNETDESTGPVDDLDETGANVDEHGEAAASDNISRDKLVGGKKNTTNISQSESYKENSQLADSGSVEWLTAPTSDPKAPYEPKDYATILN